MANNSAAEIKTMDGRPYIAFALALTLYQISIICYLYSQQKCIASIWLLMFMTIAAIGFAFYGYLRGIRPMAGVHKAAQSILSGISTETYKLTGNKVIASVVEGISSMAKKPLQSLALEFTLGNAGGTRVCVCCPRH